MKAVIQAKNMGIAPARFGMRVYHMDEKLRADLATTVELERLVEPGDVIVTSFDWPFDDYHPGDFRYKALRGQAGVWQMLRFDVGSVRVLLKPGMLA